MNIMSNWLHIQDQSVKQSVEHVLVETIRDRWSMIIGSNPTAGNASKKEDQTLSLASADEDDFRAVLSDLDLESFKEILSIKSEQEEVADFSFSFNQSDICLAVVQWINQVRN